jgi:hypothetical protein
MSQQKDLLREIAAATSFGRLRSHQRLDYRGLPDGRTDAPTASSTHLTCLATPQLYSKPPGIDLLRLHRSGRGIEG